MQLRIFFIIATFVFIALGVYTFTQSRQFVEADDNKKLQMNSIESSTTRAPTIDSRLIVAEGQFHNVAHTGAGTATIYRGEDGRLFLRFTEFETAPAADLQVCLHDSDEAQEAKIVRRADYLLIAPLKEIMGNQTYELPANLDVAKYRAVTIFSRRSRVNFATAPFTRQQK